MEWTQDKLSGLRGNDAEAIRAWIGQYAAQVRDVGLAYLGTPEEAAAFAKQVFARALTAIQSGYSPVDMEDWLLGLARARGSQAALAKPIRPLPPQTAQPMLRPFAHAAAPLQPQPPAAPAIPMEPLPPEPPAAPEPPAVDAGWEDADYDAGLEPDLGETWSASAQAVPSLFGDEEDDPWGGEPPLRRKSPLRRFFGALAVLVLIAIIAGLLWALAGLLMNVGVLPAYELGYAWFNANVYPFF